MEDSSIEHRIRREFEESTPNLGGYDLGFRPTRYWEQPARALNATALPEHVRADLEAGRDPAPPKAQAALEAFDPSYMGGAYMPPLEDWEVEIARAVLKSATSDVIAFRARPGADGKIEYRVVNEYEDEGYEYFASPESSDEPLTFGAMVLFVASADGVNGSGESLGSVFRLGRSFDSPSSDFATFSSAYYPELGRFFAEEDERFFYPSLYDEPEEDDSGEG